MKEKIQRVNPDYRYGLTKEQIKERLDGGWTNIEVDVTSMTVKEIVRKNVLTYFNLIFAVLAVLLCLVGAIRELSFLPIVVINTVVGIIQEIRAKNILEKMSMLNAPRTDVVRNGRIRSVASEKLVADDIVIFENGSQICADAVVGFMILYKICLPLNTMRFGILLAFSIAMGPALRCFTRLNEIIQGLYKKHPQKRYKKH